MSGYCYSCASHFGTFNKELGCKNCGFAFCKKCLTKKTTLPQCNNAKLAVCNKCYDVLTGKKTAVANSASFNPPDAYFKRLAALENAPSQQPSRHSTQPQVVHRHSPAKQKGLSKKDAAIAERLQKLKDATRPANVPSQSEIEARLNQLKQAETSAAAGDVNDRQNQRHVFPVVGRTQQEQIDALLDEISDEVEIDARSADTGPVTNIRDTSQCNEPLNDINRTAASRPSQPVDTVNICTESTTADDTTDMERLMRQVAAEMQIDAQQAIDSLRKDKQLWDRVERLKQDIATCKGDVSEHDNAVSADTVAESDSEDEETATKRIIQQLIEENRLDERSGIKDLPPTHNSSKKKQAAISSTVSSTAGVAELPWCCICNEDATLRCRGCDGDLYCQRCFKEGHDRWDVQEHKTVRYSAPAQSNH